MPVSLGTIGSAAGSPEWTTGAHPGSIRSITVPDASHLTRDQIAHLASLARIALEDAEVERLTGELAQIMDAVARVQEVATPDVPATSHPIPLSNVFRADVPGETLTPGQVLAGAPDHDGSRFRVSAILGEEQ